MNTNDIRFKYADKTSLEMIKLMHPKVRNQLLDDYLTINMQLPNYVRLRLSQTLRTIKEQDALYAQGRTVKGSKVTNAKGGQSYHNYGLAFDIVILFDKDKNGSFETASWERDVHFNKVVSFFKSKGWQWGGDFKSFKDYPHFEKTYGYRISELKAMVTDKQPYPNI